MRSSRALSSLGGSRWESVDHAALRCLFCQEQVKNYPGETSEPSWDRFLLQPQEKPTPREAEPSALWSNSEQKSSLCGTEKNPFPLSSGLKMNLIPKWEARGWGTVSNSAVCNEDEEVPAWPRGMLAKGQSRKSPSQRPHIYLPGCFIGLNKKISK